jgi:hypothetical protein
MQVQRVWESPRVTRPYTDVQWAAIENFGHELDHELAAGDVRLTMGGEPTFVSMDDPDGAEWNTSADGPHKRRLAAQLFQRLRARYAPEGLVHFGQGKWYPGEPLPRWSLNCYWRRDGQPIWQHPELLADESRDYGVDALQAQQFLEQVATRLALDAECVFPAFEDVYYYLWRERRLPENVDPFDWIKWSVMCCRWRATPAASTGRADRGCCAPGVAISCPAIHRSAIDCRSTHCPGLRLPITITFMRQTRRRRRRRCRLSPKCAYSIAVAPRQRRPARPQHRCRPVSRPGGSPAVR